MEKKICRYCGNEIPAGNDICTKCGKPVERPLGVSAVSIGSLALGIPAILMGVINVLYFRVVGNPFGSVFYVFTLILGILLLFGGMGLWKLARWGWTLTIIASMTSIVISLYGFLTGLPDISAYYTPSSAILYLIMASYLVTKREFFGV